MDATQDKRETLVLGIETSCDETAAAVVARAADGRGRILSNVVRAQWEQHRRYGGVIDRVSFYAPYRSDPDRWAQVLTDIRAA